MQARAHLAFGEIMDRAVALGGTIKGEHGVGRMKQPWLEGKVGTDGLDATRRIKHAFDLLNILNPGPS